MENELSRVVDALPGLVWAAIPDGHVDFLNRRSCEYTAQSPNDGPEATFSFSPRRAAEDVTDAHGVGAIGALAVRIAEPVNGNY